MRRIWFGGLFALSGALLLAFVGLFMLRWGVRGLVPGVVVATVLIAAAVAAEAARERAPRLAAACVYGALIGLSALSITDEYKNSLIRDLLWLQAATGLVGAIGCALPRRRA
jgi:hypothetical protein